MVFCTHGPRNPTNSAICGLCLIDAMQNGRSSALIYEVFTSVTKELELSPSQCPVSDISLVTRKLCDSACYLSVDLLRTYSIRLLFLLRKFISLDSCATILGQLIDCESSQDSDLRTVIVLICLCLLIPYDKEETMIIPRATLLTLLTCLPQYNRLLGTALDNVWLNILPGVSLLVYVLAVQLSLGLLKDGDLIQEHSEALQQFQGVLHQCITVTSTMDFTDKLLVHGLVLALQCYEEVLSLLLPQTKAIKKKIGIYKQVPKAPNEDERIDDLTESEQVLSAFQICFSNRCLLSISLNTIYFTAQSTIFHSVYNGIEPMFSSSYAGLGILRQAIEQYDARLLISVFFALPIHGPVTKAIAICLLSNMIQKKGVQNSKDLFDSISLSMKNCFLTEINNLLLFQVMSEYIGAMSTIVAGIMASKTSYYIYNACIAYLNEALKSPLTFGTTMLLSLPAIVSRDDFPEFISQISIPEGEPSISLINCKTKLILHYLNSKLKQGRVPSPNTLVDTLLTYCDCEAIAEATTLEELASILGMVVTLSLEQYSWYKLFLFLSPLLDSLLNPEESTASTQDQKIRILKTQLLGSLIDISSKYWRLEATPSITVLAEAVDSLRTYGRGVFNSIDSILFWLIISRLARSKRPFDIVGTISFALTQLDILCVESDELAVAQRYLATLIVIFLEQAKEYQLSETGKNMYTQIWRYMCAIRQKGPLSFCCEEATFIGYAIKERDLLVQNTEVTRPRIQLVCSWTKEQKQHGYVLDLHLLVHLCFLDTAQNYRASYPTMDTIFYRHQPEEYLASIVKMPSLEAAELCVIVGLSSVSPGFSLQFAALILIRVCYNWLVAARVVDGQEATTDMPPKRTELTQMACDALERLIKRVKSKQGAVILPSILLTALALDLVDVSAQMAALLEVIVSEHDDILQSDTVWLNSAMAILLESTDSGNDEITKNFIALISPTSLAADDPVLTLLVIIWRMKKPITIESACEVGVSMGKLLFYIYNWNHSTPQLILNYMQSTRAKLNENPAVKAMADRGFVLWPGELIKSLTAFTDTICWNDIIRDCTSGEYMEVVKRVLFISLICSINGQQRAE